MDVDRMIRDGRWQSFACALGFVLSLVLLGILEATHTPPIMMADNARVGKVMLCFILAALFSILSFIVAAWNIAHGDWWPLAWLVPLALGWWAFLDWWLLPIVRSL